jgi:hypothetical protein
LPLRLEACGKPDRQWHGTSGHAGKEGFFRHGKVTMVVHPAMMSDSADELCTRSEAVIKETLHQYDYKIKV